MSNDVLSIMFSMLKFKPFKLKSSKLVSAVSYGITVKFLKFAFVSCTFNTVSTTVSFSFPKLKTSVFEI